MKTKTKAILATSIIVAYSLAFSWALDDLIKGGRYGKMFFVGCGIVLAVIATYALYLIILERFKGNI